MSFLVLDRPNGRALPRMRCVRPEEEDRPPCHAELSEALEEAPREADHDDFAGELWPTW